MKYVSILALLFVASGASAEVLEVTSSIEQSSTLVGATGVLHLVITSISLDTTAAPHVTVVGNGATLGAGSVSATGGTTVLQSTGDVYQLPSIAPGGQLHVNIAVQLLAESGTIVTTAQTQAGLFLTESVASFTTRAPNLGLSLAAADGTRVVGDTVSMTLTVVRPASPFAYEGMRLRLKSAGLELLSVGTLTASNGEYPFATPQVDAPLVVPISARVVAPTATLTAGVVDGAATTRSEARSVSIAAALPMLGIDARIENTTPQLGQAATVFVKVAAPAGTYTYEGLRLQVLLKGVAVVEAKLDESLLVADGDFYVLPTLAGGASKKLAITAKITELEASAETVVIDQNGHPVSPSKSVTLSSQQLTYSAGCNASAGHAAFIAVACLLLRRRARDATRARCVR